MPSPELGARAATGAWLAGIGPLGPREAPPGGGGEGGGGDGGGGGEAAAPRWAGERASERARCDSADVLPPAASRPARPRRLGPDRAAWKMRLKNQVAVPAPGPASPTPRPPAVTGAGGRAATWPLLGCSRRPAGPPRLPGRGRGALAGGNRPRAPLARGLLATSSASHLAALASQGSRSLPQWPPETSRASG